MVMASAIGHAVQTALSSKAICILQLKLARNVGSQKVFATCLKYLQPMNRILTYPWLESLDISEMMKRKLITPRTTINMGASTIGEQLMYGICAQPDGQCLVSNQEFMENLLKKLAEMQLQA